ncbi:hypothetical protein M0802_009994 [Mischocyttarus mexicanus]|nr:hypothetical protein M0802_009994 [Mischocyttarus mexicanus]
MKTETLGSEWIITEGQVIRVIQTLKNRKALREDTITNEQIKYGGPCLVKAIKTLLNKIIKEENVPET